MTSSRMEVGDGLRGLLAGPPIALSFGGNLRNNAPQPIIVIVALQDLGDPLNGIIR